MANELQVRQRRGGGGTEVAKASAVRAAAAGPAKSRNELQGLQVGPTAVLVISLVFIGVIILLHIVGKFIGE